MTGEIVTRLVFDAQLRSGELDKDIKRLESSLRKTTKKMNTTLAGGGAVDNATISAYRKERKELKLLKEERALVQKPIMANAQRNKKAFDAEAKEAKTRNRIQTSMYQDRMGLEKQESKQRMGIQTQFKTVDDDHTKALYEDEKRTKKLTQTKRGFRFELLSTMFAGMALTQALDGQIKSVRKLIGAEQLHEAAMMTAYLPAQLQLADMSRGMDEWILNLGDGEKAAIGWGVQIANWGGQALMTFSQIGLALDGIEKLGGIKGVLSLPVSMAKQIAGLFGAGGAISKIAGISGTMGSKGSAGLPSGKLLQKAFSKFSGSFVKVFTGMGKSLTNLGEFGSFSIASTLWDKISQFGAALAGAIGWAVGKIATLFTEFAIGDKLTSIVTGISGFFKKIADKVAASQVGTWFSTAWSAVKGAATGFFDWISTSIKDSKIITWFTSAFAAVLSGASDFFSWMKTRILESKIITWFTGAFLSVLAGAESFFLWMKLKIVESQAAAWFTNLFAPVKLALGGLALTLATALAAVAVAAEAYLDFESLSKGPNKEGIFEGGGVGIGLGNAGNVAGGGTYYNPATGELTQAGLLAQQFLAPGNFRIGDYMDYGQISGDSSNLIAAILANTSRNAAQMFIADYFRNNGLSAIYGRQVLDAGGFEGWVEQFRKGYSGPFAFANGGIVSRPTMGLVGESGPEAVIPLDKLSDFGGSNITINIDAKVSNDMDLRALAQKISDIITINQRSSLSL